MKKKIQWVMIIISAMWMTVLMVLSHFDVSYLGWQALAWWLFHNSIWVIGLIGSKNEWEEIQRKEREHVEWLVDFGREFPRKLGE